MIRASAVLAVVALSAAPACSDAADPLSDAASVEYFETHIRPALEAHCLDCHAADTEASGNLLLDSRPGWEIGGDLGAAIVPGDAESSLLVEVVRYGNDELQMPPDGKLDDATIAHLERWIDAGATDPREGDAAVDAKPAKQTGLPVERAQEHWAYQPLVESPLDPSRPLHERIDALVEQRLAEDGLRPLPPASPRALLRRLSFDLTGLPPSPDQLAAFERHPTDERYAAIVDEMLASTAYAETFARHWMDVVRYAESITLRGFILPNAWRYRDYLVQAFDDDRGFDRMIAEQLAGDLLNPVGPNDIEPHAASSLASGHGDARQSIAVATGFLAMGNSNLEDQNKTQLEFDFIDEQLETIGRAFLGQTIGCARCHDHKFDPIPTADYYAMAAIMRSTAGLSELDGNIAKWIDHPLPLPAEQLARYDRLRGEQADLKKAIKTLKGEVVEGKAPRSTPAAELPGLVVDDVDAVFVGEWKDSEFADGFVGAGYRHDDNASRISKTATFAPKTIASGRYEVRMSYTPGGSRSTRVKVEVFSANESTIVTVNQRKRPTIDGIWVSLGEFPFEEDGLAYVMVSNEGSNGHVIVDAVQFLPVDGPSGEVIVDDEESNEQLAAAKKKLAAKEARLKVVDAALAERPRYLAVVEREPVASMPIRIRGVLDQHGETVPRGFLSAVAAADDWAGQLDTGSSGRLQMAGWLCDDRNALTARVYANRVWCWTMGDGLVASENNFGLTGTPPSHRDLLDLLARELQTHGWSTKHLVGQIVRTEAYRRRVATAEERGASPDPANRLLWAANLKRLTIEAMRDAMLAHSGELDRTPFGPSIRPGTKNDYEYDHDSVRRSLYQPMFRNSPPPLYEVFDFANNSVSVGQRDRSTVATQSLAMLNHSWVRGRAERAGQMLLGKLGIAADQPLADADRGRLIDAAFARYLGRPPTPSERDACASLLRQPSDAGTLAHSLFASIDFRYLD